MKYSNCSLDDAKAVLDRLLAGQFAKVVFQNKTSLNAFSEEANELGLRFQISE
jgi:hypothetical protein